MSATAATQMPLPTIVVVDSSKHLKEQKAVVIYKPQQSTIAVPNRPTRYGSKRLGVTFVFYDVFAFQLGDRERPPPSSAIRRRLGSRDGFIRPTRRSPP